MQRHNNEAEIRFAAKIDCRFPYDDRVKASALIEEGWAISLDASYGVLHEISRKPKFDCVTQQRQHELIDEWAAQFEHPLKEPLVRCARALTDRQYLPWIDAVKVMSEIAPFHGQYAALNIACFAGDSDSDEGDRGLEAAHERVCKVWGEPIGSVDVGLPQSTD
jgi:hypothetical protein